jgi:hypothetical protein
MLKERQRNKLSRKITLLPGDVLVCKVQDRKTKTHETFVEEIERTIEVDTVVTFDVDGETLGLVDGIGAIFGKSA